jgi:hypothetical protein
MTDAEISQRAEILAAYSPDVARILVRFLGEKDLWKENVMSVAVSQEIKISRMVFSTEIPVKKDDKEMWINALNKHIAGGRVDEQR